MQVSRFECPSSSLDLRRLLQRARQILEFAVVAALAGHLGVAQIRGFAQEHRVAKPLTTQFIKRQPRLTKPLELKKRPVPKQRRIQRKMVSVTARWSRGKASTIALPAQSLGGLAKPHPVVSRSGSWSEPLAEPEAIAAAVEGSKEPANKVDLSLDMMDIDALDTGLYHAMVVQDPDDKRNIRGFFHVAIAYSKSLHVDTYNKTFYADSYALHALVNAMNEYTDIRTDIRGAYTFDSRELFRIPFIMIIVNGQGGIFRVTASESSNLGRYLISGGFAFIEDSFWMAGGPSDRSLRATQREALGSQGLTYKKDWDFEKLPNWHAVYHCYFDFEGPPPGHDNICIGANYGGGGGRAGAPYKYLEGVSVDGRTIIIYSMKSIGTVWHRTIKVSERHAYDTGGTRQLQFGVNLIVFALTQEGSITNRVMDEVR